MTPATAAVVAALLLFALALFHAALALGAPGGALAWGGQTEGVLPPRLQLGSTILTPIILGMGAVMLIRGGWLYPELARNMIVPVWGIFLFLITQLFGALRSESPRERRVMTPLYAAGAALSAFVAFGA